MIGNLPLKRLQAAASASTGTKINFKVSPQDKDRNQWCWAAVASSIANYYDPGSEWSQCKIASAELGHDCCADGTGICDQMWELDKALTRTKNLKDYISGVLDTGKITTELQNKCPVCIRVQWSNGGSHFLVVTGAYTGSDGGDSLILSDPIYGEGECEKSILIDGFYQHPNGRWTDTYLTEA